NPMEAARQAMRPSLRRRFYARAEVAEGADGFSVLLDGKPVRTPTRRALAAPGRALAEALATGWGGQREVIVAAAMPLTRLANSIIDGVADAPGAVAAEITKYLGTDLIFYRAQEPEALRVRQARHWDPVLDWAHEVFDARFMLAESVVHVAQP